MSIPSIPDSQQLLALETRAERWALTVLRGTTFTDCLRINSLAPLLEVSTPEGKTITIRGSDIYDNRTWKKFLASINQEECVYQLTDVGEELARQYKTWLLKEHTARYRVLSAEADLTWFERVVVLAVTWHIMDQKYKAYTTKGLQTFADQRAAIEMSNLLMLRGIAREIPRSVHHVLKEPDRAKELIELFYEETYRQLQARSLIMSEHGLSLLGEASSPFAVLAEREEELHE